MSSRPPELIFADILEAGEKAISYATGMTLDDFRSNDLVFDAVARNLMIIGEAAARLSEADRARHRIIPWKQIVGFRNVVVHEYFGVDREAVWDILRNNVPELIEMIRRHAR